MAALLWNFAMCFGIGGILIPLAILGWQSFIWLKFGAWPPVLTLDAFAYLQIAPPSFEWVGVNTIVEDILLSPLALTVFFTGMVVGTICAIVAEQLEKAERQRQNQHRIRERERNNVR